MPLLLFYGKYNVPPDWQVPLPCLLTEVPFLFHFLYTHSHSLQYTDAYILRNIPHPPSFSKSNLEWHRNRSVLSDPSFSQVCNAGCRSHQKTHCTLRKQRFIPAASTGQINDMVIRSRRFCHYFAVCFFQKLLLLQRFTDSISKCL